MSIDEPLCVTKQRQRNDELTVAIGYLVDAFACELADCEALVCAGHDFPILPVVCPAR